MLQVADGCTLLSVSDMFRYDEQDSIKAGYVQLQAHMP